MAMLVLLLDTGSSVTSIDPTTAARLAELGVTNIALLRNDTTMGVVLDGWAFDPARSGTEAASIFGDTGRTLHPVLQTVLTPRVRGDSI